MYAFAAGSGKRDGWHTHCAGAHLRRMMNDQPLQDAHQRDPRPANPPPDEPFMYYDDQGRRFNLVTGLLFGTLLGAGIALLAAPHQRVANPRAVRRSARRVSRRTGGAMDALREKVMEAVSSSLAEAWKSAK
jgi:hypothetical protein